MWDRKMKKKGKNKKINEAMETGVTGTEGCFRHISSGWEAVTSFDTNHSNERLLGEEKEENWKRSDEDAFVEIKSVEDIST